MHKQFLSLQRCSKLWTSYLARVLETESRDDYIEWEGRERAGGREGGRERGILESEDRGRGVTD